MKFKSYFSQFIFALAAVACFALPIAAQEEGEAQVVDEVIAQVNGDVITLSQLRRESKQAMDAFTRNNTMTEAQAKAEVEKRKPEVIANLITEQLVLQQGKELGYTERTEAELNRRMIDLAKQQNIPYAQLDDAMRAAGIDPTVFRNDARRGIMTNMVLTQEVDYKLYNSFTPEEVRKFYDANQARFRKPETYTLSEIFLSRAGKNEAEVRATADRLVREARAGKDFGELAAANSDRESTRNAKGKIGSFAISEISKADIAAALKPLKQGEVTNPLPSDDGFLILRVDERTAEAAPAFDEQQARVALAEDRSPKERIAYLGKLRTDAYVKIADGYRTAVEEVLNKTTKTADNTTATPAVNSLANTKK